MAQKGLTDEELNALDSRGLTDAELDSKSLSVADRHNNPLNMKAGPSTKYWVDNGHATVGEKATDGGNFLKFNSPAIGRVAAIDYLNGPNYSNLTVDDAMRKWSNNGYGADVMPNINPTSKISDLSSEDLSSLVSAMAVREGYTGATLPAPSDSRPAVNKSSHGASGSWKPSITEKIMEKVSPYLPSARTAARVIGGTVGGATAGPLGVVPGVSIGESAYQLVNPEGTPEESAAQHTDAIGGAMLAEAVPYLAKYHGEHPLLPALRRTASGLNASSQTLITRGLNPTDRAFQDHVERGLSELKASERTVGPIKEVSKARQGLDTRTSFYNNEIKKNIIDPQSTIVVPGTGSRMAEDQIAAIPSDYKAHNPEGYAKLVRKIQSAHPQDYTIGELDTLRSELSATQSPYYGKDVSGQLTMDSGTRAIDIARGRSARAQLYKGLDTYGLGGGEQAAEANRRIGSIIHFQDALGDKANASVAEKLPPFRRLTKKITSPLTTSGTDENLALAIKRWKNTPEDIKVRLEPRVGGTVGQQQDLLPTNSGPLLDQPAQTSSGIGDSWQAQQEAMRAQRAAPPADIEGQQQPLNTFPGPLGNEQFRPKGTYLDPEEEYLQEMKQRRIWSKGQPKVKPGQMNLQPTVIKPGGRPAKPLFGGKASSAAEVDENLIPPGSKLAFKSKGFYGEMYHYETPDGRVITLDHELSPEFTKTPVQGAYEPGTSHAGSPYKEPTPPPRLKKGQKRL